MNKPIFFVIFLQFYITLGVAVGGVAEFPDGCKSQGYTKPWRNVESKVFLLLLLLLTDFLGLR